MTCRRPATLADGRGPDRAWPVERALDVGTGYGIQALLAASHADQVVATDVTERALAFAALNCALNGSRTSSCGRAASSSRSRASRSTRRLKPAVRISPESGLVFRDSGLGGDRVSVDLVRCRSRRCWRTAASRSVMVSWIQPPGTTRPLRPAPGSRAPGAHAWILHTTYRRPAPAPPAALETANAPSPAEYTERIERWLEYFPARGDRGDRLSVPPSLPADRPLRGSARGSCPRRERRRPEPTSKGCSPTAISSRISETGSCSRRGSDSWRRRSSSRGLAWKRASGRRSRRRWRSRTGSVFGRASTRPPRARPAPGRLTAAA